MLDTILKTISADFLMTLNQVERGAILEDHQYSASGVVAVEMNIGILE